MSLCYNIFIPLKESSMNKRDFDALASSYGAEVFLEQYGKMDYKLDVWLSDDSQDVWTESMAKCLSESSMGGCTISELRDELADRMRCGIETGDS